MHEPVLLEQSEGIATISLNQPDKHNALTLRMLDALYRVLQTCQDDDDVKVIVLRGLGKSFCVSVDLEELCEQGEQRVEYFEKLATQIHETALYMRAHPCPIIGAINGDAAGGGLALALACDFRVVSERAVFKQAAASLGLCVSGSAGFFLTRLLGAARAMEVVALDRALCADEIAEFGLCYRAVPDDAVLDTANVLAGQLLKSSMHAFSWTKRLIYSAFDHPLSELLALERDGVVSCAGHGDSAEGIAAHLEKRQPRFNR